MIKAIATKVTPKNSVQFSLSRILPNTAKINFIYQDFENRTPLERTGYLDCTYGGKRYFVGDISPYWVSKNTSLGFAGAYGQY